MFVDDVNNARHHGERNNSKDNGEGLAGPTGSDTAPATHSGSQDHRTPMSTFERLRRHGKAALGSSGLFHTCIKIQV